MKSASKSEFLMLTDKWLSLSSLKEKQFKLKRSILALIWVDRIKKERINYERQVLEHIQGGKFRLT